MIKIWFEKFGEFISEKKGRWIVLISWILLAAILNFTLPQASTQKNDLAPNLSQNTPSQQAKKLAEKEFSSNSGIPALLTWYRASGLTTNDLRTIQSYSKLIDEQPVPAQEMVAPYYKFPLPMLKGQISKDGTTLVLPVNFKKNQEVGTLASGIKELKEKANIIFSKNLTNTKLTDKEKLVLRITGPAAISVDAKNLFSQGDLSLLLGTVSIVLILLLLIYRSPILAIIPLIGVGIAYGVISPILGGIAKSGLATFDSQSLSIMTVLLFGAGTDYCLFLISRYRGFLELERDKKLAMKNALLGSSGAITMSGLTVVFSLLVLLLAKYGAVQRFAIPFSLSILIMMAASLTLIPAILSILGRASFYPFVPRTREMKEKRALKKGKELSPETPKLKIGMLLGDWIIKRPWQLLIITLLFLGVFAFFATKISYTYDTLSSFPKDMPSREGFKLISEHYNAGELAPVQIMVQTDGKNTSVKDQLQKLSFVAKVANGIRGSKDSSILSYDVQLKSNPYSNNAMDEIPLLRSTTEKALHDSHLSNVSNRVWIGGQTAEQYDTSKTTNRDSHIIIPIVISLIAILLFVYLRSVTTMVYLIVTVLLSYTSALGLGWVILHYIFGVEAIQGFIPLYAFVFIVALGEDYNIFMVSSIWKKIKQMSFKRAIKEGVAESGGVITSAGLILAGTFLVLTTLPIQILVHFGTITAIGVLLDTFIVRPLLVPAIAVLLGKVAFWPSKQNRQAIQQNAEI